MQQPIAEYQTGSVRLLSDEEHCGAYLRQEREQRNVSLEELSWATKIKLDYLYAIEEGDMSILPADIFVKGYIKSYAQYLEIDPEQVMRRYVRSAGCREAQVKVVPKTAERLSPVSRFFLWIDSVKRMLTGREDFQLY